MNNMSKMKVLVLVPIGGVGESILCNIISYIILSNVWDPASCHLV